MKTIHPDHHLKITDNPLSILETTTFHLVMTKRCSRSP